MRTLAQANFDFRILNNLKIKLIETNPGVGDEMTIKDYEHIKNTFFKEKV